MTKYSLTLDNRVMKFTIFHVLKKNYMVISVYSEYDFHKVQHLIMIFFNSEKRYFEKAFLKLINAQYIHMSKI